MENIAGFPFFEVAFDRESKIVDSDSGPVLAEKINRAGITDLIILAHGWKNNTAEAKNLYGDLLTELRRALEAVDPIYGGDRVYGALGVYWPAKKFTDKRLIPGGVARVDKSIAENVLIAELDELKGEFAAPDSDGKLDEAKRLIPRLDESTQVQEELADLVRSLVSKDAADTQEDDGADLFFSLPGNELMNRLERRPRSPSRPTTPQGELTDIDDDVMGGAARAGDTVRAVGRRGVSRGPLEAAQNLLNNLTYYEMKTRAGTVGAQGLAPFLGSICTVSVRPLRLHLVGHSFGARLVTAAVDSDIFPKVPLTLSLLQAAFSHNAFGKRFDGRRNGVFRRVVEEGRVSGPLLITHTMNDDAVGRAYPLASRLIGDDAARIGGKNDIFGGLGCNGAQHTPEAVNGSLKASGHLYEFQAGRVYNLKADAYINDHNDIRNEHVLYALASSMAMP